MKTLVFSVPLLLLNVLVLSQSKQLIDKNATAETKALYKNLDKLSKQHILFGHQHATEYGHGWLGDANRSDVKSVTGSHPAVIGVDLAGFTNVPDADKSAAKEKLIGTISDTYNRGGVVTVAWHFSNPTSGGGFYWKDSISKPAVKLIIPGAAYHEQYKAILKSIAELIRAAKGKDGKLVPMIFRPYHELDGDWFWWGRSHCSADEMKTLWRFTVSYLRDTLQVHNLIYAFSPDCLFTNVEAYTERYPGNDWVDIVGMDDYADFGRDGHYNLEAGFKKLQIVHDFAVQNKKLAAFTETGLESIRDSSWWTEKLLATLQKEKLELCYVLVWRNDSKSPTHFYAPFPGQVSEKDFIEFYYNPYTLFEADLKNIYR